MAARRALHPNLDLPITAPEAAIKTQTRRSAPTASPTLLLPVAAPEPAIWPRTRKPTLTASPKAATKPLPRTTGDAPHRRAPVAASPKAATKPPPTAPSRAAKGKEKPQTSAAVPTRKEPLRGYRVVDLSQPYNTNTREGALLFALRIFSDSSAAWERLQQTGASDAEIQTAIESYFPVLLGFHAQRQKGFYIGRLPEPFFLWGNPEGTGGYLIGPALLKKVRDVLCLPDAKRSK